MEVDQTAMDITLLVKWTGLSVWSVALSSTDINAYASCPPVGNENGLVGYWNLMKEQVLYMLMCLLMVILET